MAVSNSEACSTQVIGKNAENKLKLVTVKGLLEVKVKRSQSIQRPSKNLITILTH